MRIASVRAALPVVALVLAAACGSGTSDQAPPGATAAKAAARAMATAAPGALDASQVLTKADAEAVLGKEVGDPTVSNTAGVVSTCNYMAKDLTGLHLLIRAAASPDAARVIFEEARKQAEAMSRVEPEPVSGLGDAAYWAGGDLNQLNVVKGRYWMIFSAPMADHPLELTKQAAERALPRVQ
jgi:hypothetical protein